MTNPPNMAELFVRPVRRGLFRGKARSNDLISIGRKPAYLEWDGSRLENTTSITWSASQLGRGRYAPSHVVIYDVRDTVVSRVEIDPEGLTLDSGDDATISRGQLRITLKSRSNGVS